MLHVDAFLQAVIAWATAQAPISGVLLVGSYAHGTARPDSDLDLVIIAADPAHYLDDRGWLAQFGPVMRIEHEDWGAVQSLRAFYAGGLEVEWGLTGAAWARTDPVDPGTAHVVADGCRILLDRDGALAALIAAVPRAT